MDLDDTAMVRHRRKMNKRKLRAQEKARLASLETSVARLRHETADLESTLSDKFAEHVPISALLGVVQRTVAALATGWSPAVAHTQEALLSSLFRPDIAFNGAVVGPVNMIERWKRSCQAARGFAMALESVDVVARRLVRLQLRVGFESPRESAEAMYPDVEAILGSNPLFRTMCHRSPPPLRWTCHVTFDEHFRVKRLEIDPQYAALLTALWPHVDDVIEIMTYLETKARSRTIQL
ncbi:hypothetical protein SDRG_09642 [Saprolegnia diclina VS20]|uniref:BZIP domain-containing protein n=1 Tax=Saprolegnia diclina (strain VS20) TaxID=1156394 RepID=T0QD49_SAPDV|nr:hypothetical protein SDRG_09642 [Saprolegnia diclina VS20]EQC32666.1 hypothetical protein SDRG_09642 [Saprolegnia diclina VS20]|eukprot:XP_008613810.1 hypothetical protein SDRG_09642 [Saprolegnia diclina VS20]